MPDQSPPPNTPPDPRHGAYPTPPHGGPPPYGPQPYGGPPYGGPSYEGPQPYGAPVPYGAYAGGPLLPLAHRGRRLLARTIDSLIVSVLATALIVPLILLVTSQDPEGETAWVAVGILGSLLILFGGWILYEGLQLAQWGRTPGKRWMRLRVVSADPPGAPLTRGRAFGRAAVYPPGFILVNVLPLVSFVGLLNLLWQFWDKPFQQCLHDKIAGTIVIDDGPANGPAVTSRDRLPGV